MLIRVEMKVGFLVTKSCLCCPKTSHNFFATDDGFDETLIPLDYKKSGQIVDDEIFQVSQVSFVLLGECVP